MGLEKYTLSELEDKFEKDGDKYAVEHLKRLRKWEENYPYVVIPEHMEDDFNLSWALHTLTAKLMDLQLEIEELKEEMRGWKIMSD